MPRNVTVYVIETLLTSSCSHRHIRVRFGARRGQTRSVTRTAGRSGDGVPSSGRCASDAVARASSWARSDVRRPEPRPDRHRPAADGAGRAAAAAFRRRAPGPGGRCVAVASFGRAMLGGAAACHVYGRAKTVSQFIPGLPYSFVAVLEPGATSWTAVQDAVRLGRRMTRPRSPPPSSEESLDGSSPRTSGRPGTRTLCRSVIGSAARPIGGCSPGGAAWCCGRWGAASRSSHRRGGVPHLGVTAGRGLERHGRASGQRITRSGVD